MYLLLEIAEFDMPKCPFENVHGLAAVAVIYATVEIRGPEHSKQKKKSIAQEFV